MVFSKICFSIFMLLAASNFALTDSNNASCEGAGQQTTYLSRFIQRTNPSQCKNFQLASINGTDDRFTEEEITLPFLADAFRYTGKLASADGKCKRQGSGFINNGRVTTARHVLCGMVRDGCDLSKLVLITSEQTYRIANVIPAPFVPAELIFGPEKGWHLDPDQVADLELAPNEFSPEECTAPKRSSSGLLFWI